MIPRLRTRGAATQETTRGATRDDGYTLVEMLVAMAVFGVAMALVMSTLVTITRQTRNTLGRSESIENARLGLSQIDRQVRSGNLFQDPTDSGMAIVVFTQADAGRRCVEWRVETDGSLRTRGWSPTWATDSDVDPWTTYARGLVNRAPGGGQSAVPAFVKTTVGSSQPVLTVNLLVRDRNDEGKYVEIASTFSGRNTLFGYDPVVCQSVPPA